MATLAWQQNGLSCILARLYNRASREVHSYMATIRQSTTDVVNHSLVTSDVIRVTSGILPVCVFRYNLYAQRNVQVPAPVGTPLFICALHYCRCRPSMCPPPPKDGQRGCCVRSLYILREKKLCSTPGASYDPGHTPPVLNGHNVTPPAITTPSRRPRELATSSPDSTM